MLSVNLDTGLMWITSFALYFGRNCPPATSGSGGDRGESQYRRNTCYPAGNGKLVVWPLTRRSIEQAVTCGTKCLLLWICNLSLFSSLSEGFQINRGHQMPPKCRRHFQILGARNVTWRKSHSEDQNSGTTYESDSYVTLYARCMWTVTPNFM